jgi:hypothetical protein
MIRVVVGQDDRVGNWIGVQTQSVWTNGRGVCIGLEDDETGNLVGGVIFEGYANLNIFAHILIDTSGRAIPRSFIFACLYYVFIQLGCKSLSAIVRDNNKICIILEKFGFLKLANIHSGGSSLSTSIYTLQSDVGIEFIKRRFDYERS